MTYIPDLTAMSYMRVAGRVRAVGWIEASRPFKRGPVSDEFVTNLKRLMRERLFGTMMLGLHWCSVCEAEGQPGPDGRSSQSELFVPGAECVFEAPMWLAHYVIAHGYQPPDEFIRAVIACPDLGTPEYQTAVLAQCPEFAEEVTFEMFSHDIESALARDPIHGVRMRQRDEASTESAVRTRDDILNEFGVGPAKCMWASCENLVLRDRLVCVDHAYFLNSP